MPVENGARPARLVNDVPPKLFALRQFHRWLQGTPLTILLYRILLILRNYREISSRGEAFEGRGRASLGGIVAQRDSHDELCLANCANHLPIWEVFWVHFLLAFAPTGRDMIRGQSVSPPDSDVPVKAGTDRCRSFWFREAGGRRFWFMVYEAAGTFGLIPA